MVSDPGSSAVPVDRPGEHCRFLSDVPIVALFRFGETLQ
jgi:hypothetical protein